MCRSWPLSPYNVSPSSDALRTRRDVAGKRSHTVAAMWMFRYHYSFHFVFEVLHPDLSSSYYPGFNRSSVRQMCISIAFLKLPWRTSHDRKTRCSKTHLRDILADMWLRTYKNFFIDSRGRFQTPLNPSGSASLSRPFCKLAGRANVNYRLEMVAHWSIVFLQLQTVSVVF